MNLPIKVLKSLFLHSKIFLPTLEITLKNYHSFEKLAKLVTNKKLLVLIPFLQNQVGLRIF